MNFWLPNQYPIRNRQFSRFGNIEILVFFSTWTLSINYSLELRRNWFRTFLLFDHLELLFLSKWDSSHLFRCDMLRIKFCFWVFFLFIGVFSRVVANSLSMSCNLEKVWMSKFVIFSWLPFQDCPLCFHFFLSTKPGMCPVSQMPVRIWIIFLFPDQLEPFLAFWCLLETLF